MYNDLLADCFLNLYEAISFVFCDSFGLKTTFTDTRKATPTQFLVPFALGVFLSFRVKLP